MTRRASLLAAAAALAGSAAGVSEPLDAEVIVIGAGFAGLGAVQRLAQAGVSDFLLLEATDHIGGRVQSQSFGSPAVRSGRVELGANWVHGVSDQNPIWRLAERAKLRSVPIPGSCANISGYGLFWANGTQVEHAAEYSEAANRIYDCVNATAQSDSDDQSAASAFDACGWRATTALDEAIRWQLTTACDELEPEKQSLFEMLPEPTYALLGADDHFVHDQRELGFATVGHEILLDAGLNLDDPRILVSTVVGQIDSSGCDAVRVHTAEGRELRGRYVISTLPLGVMQENSASLFHPALPPAQLAGIHASTMGNFTKIFIQFPEPFWSSKGVQWMAAPESPLDPIEFHDLDVLEPGFSTLFTYVSGDASVEWEGLSDDAASERLVRRLRRLFPSAQVPEPTAFLMTRHSMDPFRRGAYSTARVGRTDEEFDAMVAPVVSCNRARVIFAGEHTCDAYSAFVHGAYFSGLDAAAGVLVSLGLSDAGPANICSDVDVGLGRRRKSEREDTTVKSV